MKRWKKVATLLLALCLAGILCACGGGGDTSVDTSNDMTPPAPTKKEKESGVKNEEEIKEDLDQEDFYTFFDFHCYDDRGVYQGSSFSIEQIEILRRKINEEAGTDDVYITASAANGSSRFTGNFHLSYVLYDVGGWFLEEIELESGDYEPLSHVPDEHPLGVVMELVGDFLEENDAISIRNRRNPTPINEEITVAVDYSDEFFGISGTVTLSYFHDGSGWNYEDMVNNLNYNLRDGTYRCPKLYNYPAYLIILHENGIPVIISAATWGGKVEGLFLQEGNFDPAKRSFVCETHTYIFGVDGTISCFTSGYVSGVYEWVAEPITNQKALQTFHDEYGKEPNYALEQGEVDAQWDTWAREKMEEYGIPFTGDPTDALGNYESAFYTNTLDPDIKAKMEALMQDESYIGFVLYLETGGIASDPGYD